MVPSNFEDIEQIETYTLTSPFAVACMCPRIEKSNHAPLCQGKYMSRPQQDHHLYVILSVAMQIKKLKH